MTATPLKKHRIAVIPGDGIGHEVVPEGIGVLERVGRLYGIDFVWDEFDWSCELYTKTGRMMPKDGLYQIKNHDAIFLGAVGDPSVPDHVSLWGLLIPIRQAFQQYANVRPVRLMPGVRSPLAGRGPGDIDILIIRENTEGEYSSIGGVFNKGRPNEYACQESHFTRKGVDRVLKYAFDAAGRRRKHLTSATKSNGIAITMPYWDERFSSMSKNYPDIATAQYHIDILTAHFVRNPQKFDVVVGSNLFGDILSDLGPACAGTIAIAPSANINPERLYPSMFEPVHGSAPDIYGLRIANPVGQIWSAALMLDHLGYPEASRAVINAIELVLSEGPRTADLGGSASTSEAGRAIADAIIG
jgi:tartrate dehydrogenase/decarboxylase / D-malate dehydrogenase